MQMDQLVMMVNIQLRMQAVESTAGRHQITVQI